MSNSAHSSKSNSRAHSPTDDGAGKEDPQPMQSTSSSAAAAAPQAKPNHTAKSTDPAGQTISEAELEGRFKVIRYLGKGSYGTVFVAEELATGKQVAIKKIPKVRERAQPERRKEWHRFASQISSLVVCVLCGVSLSVLRQSHKRQATAS